MVGVGRGLEEEEERGGGGVDVEREGRNKAEVSEVRGVRPLPKRVRRC